jgi:hypothetical protein
MDKFNVEDYLKQELKLEKSDTVENFTMEFSPKDKCLIYILSQARKLLFIRHYEHHQNLKHISFSQVNPIDFYFSCDSSFVIFVLKDCKIQISPLNTEKGVISPYLLQCKDKLMVSISLNGKMIVVGSKSSLASYMIKLE